MAVFRQSYSSSHSPEQLWRVINTPLLDRDIARVIYPDVDLDYQHLNEEGLIGQGTITTFIPTEEARQKVSPVLRAFIPKDVTFNVTSVAPNFNPPYESSRHDELVSSKADGWVKRAIQHDLGASTLSVEAHLTLNGLGNVFDDKIEAALEHVFGGPSERTIAMAADILKLSSEN